MPPKKGGGSGAKGGKSKSSAEDSDKSGKGEKKGGTAVNVRKLLFKGKLFK